MAPPLTLNNSEPKAIASDLGWRWRVLGGALAIVLVGLGLTAYGVLAVREAERATQEARLSEIGTQTAETLRDRLVRAEFIAAGVQALFATRGAVDGATWRRYGEVQLARRGEVGGLLALLYVRRVPHADLAAFAGRFSAETGRPLDLRPPGARDEYYVVTYTEPPPRPGLVTGFDLTTIPAVRATMEAARDANQPRLSSPVKLNELAGGKPGMVLYAPLYRPGAPLDTVEQRRTALDGWLSAPLLLEKLLSDLGQPGSGAEVDVFDGPAPEPSALLFTSAGPRGAREKHSGAWLHDIRSVDLGGRTFTVRLVRAQAGSLHAWLIGGGGALVSFLLAGIVWSLASTRRRAVETLRRVALDNARLYAEAKDRRREAETMVAIARSLSADLDPASLSGRIVSSVLELFHADFSGLRLLRSDGSLELVGSAGLDYAPGHRIAPGEGLAGKAFADAAPVITEDYLSDPNLRVSDSLRRQIVQAGMRSGVSVPLRVRDRTIGTLQMGSAAPRGYSPREVALLQALADQAAIALDNTELYAASQQARGEAERASARLRDLESITAASLGTLDVEELIAVMAERLLLALWTDTAVILLLEKDKETLRVRAAIGFEPESPVQVRIPMSQGVVGRIARTRTSQIVEDLAQAPPVNPLLRARNRSMVGAPLIYMGDLLGVIALGSTRLNHFTDEHLRLLEPAAERIGSALGRARLFGELRAARERLGMLSLRLLGIQEDERRRLARELHDELGQSLTAAKLSLLSLQRAFGDTMPERPLEEAIDIVDRMLQQVRDLSLDLRPSLLDDLGLIPALRWYVERQAERAGLEVALVDKLGDGRLPATLETACFRIAQEALTNVVRHARATSVTVEVTRRGGEVELVVSDDGQGFDVPAARTRARLGESLGLLGMEERVALLGGRIVIDSGPGTGSEIRVCLLLEPGAVGGQ